MLMYFSRDLSSLRPPKAARALHMLVRCALLKPAEDIGTFKLLPSTTPFTGTHHFSVSHP